MEKASDFSYTGTDILVSTEKTLANYNRWIVGMFAAVRRKHDSKTVLDFGAGVGSLAQIFRETEGITPHTLEIDPAQRDILFARAFAPYSSIEDLPGDIDFVYTSNVLEHIPDDEQALRDLKQKMSEQGRIAIYVPAFEMLWSTLDDKVGHQRRYTKRTMRAKLESAGFHIEHISYRDSIGFALALVFRVIGNESGEPSDASLRFFDRFLLPISRAVDVIAHPFFGKNLLVVARFG